MSTPRILTARFAGRCRVCPDPIVAGDTIVHAGRGVTFHQACASGGAAVTTVSTSSGWVGTRNVRGRCEDAPCCGCCTY